MRGLRHEYIPWTRNRPAGRLRLNASENLYSASFAVDNIKSEINISSLLRLGTRVPKTLLTAFRRLPRSGLASPEPGFYVNFLYLKSAKSADSFLRK